jgi:methionyl-tRNA formyltransferase
MPLNIIFMGTPELACQSLQALLGSSECAVRAVVTQPDRAKGRNLALQPPPVKTLALAHQLPVLQPERARDPLFIEQLAEFHPDLIAVTAFGQLLPPAILDLPQFGCLNVHTSLLPKYRGAAPIQRAILNGDAETGVTIMKMDPGLDTGPMLAREVTRIEDSDTGQTLHDRLAMIGASLLVRVIPDYVAGRLTPQPQPTEGVSHTTKIRKQDGLIDWRRSARDCWNQARGLVPWPTAFTHLPGNPPLLLKVWQAEPCAGSGPPGSVLHADKHGIVVACGTEALRVTMLQREGGKRLGAAEFLAGCQIASGTQLG